MLFTDDIMFCSTSKEGEEEKLKVEESIKKEKLENQEEENTLFKSQQASVERVTQLTRV